MSQCKPKQLKKTFSSLQQNKIMFRGELLNIVNNA